MSDELAKVDRLAESAELTVAERERLAEIDYVARRLSEKYQEMVEFYKTHEKLSSADAIAKEEAKPSEAYINLLRTMPLHQFSWFNLNDHRHSEVTLAIWEDIKEAAREEVLSGTYAFSKVNEKSPYEAAIYLAVRSAFQDQWKPQNGGEQLLVDQLTQIYCEYLHWLHRLEIRVNVDREVEDGNVKRTGKWKPTLNPYGTTPEWIETTSAMVERFHRLFLRTLRALRDLRRWNINVNINNPGQVNIGQQQVNEARIEESASDT